MVVPLFIHGPTEVLNPVLAALVETVGRGVRLITGGDTGLDKLLYYD